MNFFRKATKIPRNDKAKKFELINSPRNAICCDAFLHSKERLLNPLLRLVKKKKIEKFFYPKGSQIIAITRKCNYFFNGDLFLHLHWFCGFRTKQQVSDLLSSDSKKKKKKNTKKKKHKKKQNPYKCY